MTIFDLFILAITALSVLFGWLRGSMREAVTLLALGGGIAAIALLGPPLSGTLGDGVAGPVIVLTTLFVLAFLLVTTSLEFALRRVIGPRPPRLDRLAGGAFGLLRGWLLCGLTFLALTWYHDVNDLPAPVEEAALKGFVAGAAQTLEQIGIEGDGTIDESGEALDEL